MDSKISTLFYVIKNFQWIELNNLLNDLTDFDVCHRRLPGLTKTNVIVLKKKGSLSKIWKMRMKVESKMLGEKDENL